MWIFFVCSYKHLFNQFDTSQQVHTEIDKVPVNTFSLVFFLFHDEHDVIEELLQLFVGEVNTQLFKAVVLHRWKKRLKCFKFVFKRVCFSFLTGDSNSLGMFYIYYGDFLGFCLLFLSILSEIDPFFLLV